MIFHIFFSSRISQNQNLMDSFYLNEVSSLLRSQACLIDWFVCFFVVVFFAKKRRKRVKCKLLIVVYFVFSSNVNEVIRAVLSFLLFFYEKILYAQKAQKAQKSTKKHKNAAQQKQKTQISEHKLKMRLKASECKKSSLFAYLRFCVFCAREEKK